MTQAFRSPFTRAWLALIAATMLSYLVAEGAESGKLATSVALMIAAMKVRWVFLYFMELKIATGAWRWVFELWTLLVLALTLGWYLVDAL